MRTGLNHYFKICTLPFIFLLSLSFSFAVHADSSADLHTETYTFKEAGWDNSITLNGYKPNYTFYFPISLNSHPEKMRMHLKLYFSSLLTEGTQLNIQFNQTDISTVTFPKNGKNPVEVDVDLPTTQLADSWQSIDFHAFLKSNTVLCDPGVWIQIAQDSSFSITIPAKSFNATLNQIPDLFINPLVIKVQELPIIYMPPENSADIFNMLQLALNFGRLSNNSKINLSTVPLDALTAKEKNSNGVFTGLANQLRQSKEGMAILANPSIGDGLEKNAGLILLTPSPFNPLYGLLTITGITDLALKKARNALLMPNFDKIVSGKVAVINKAKFIAEKPFNDNWYNSSFKSLGYSNQTVLGLGHHKLTFEIPLPNDRKPGNSTLNTWITSPGFKDNDNAQVTLWVNGHRQSSIILTQTTSTWKVNINADAMKPGINNIEYRIDLHLEKEACTLQEQDQSWATIQSETTFNTMFINQFPDTNLNQLPVPFANRVTLIIPDNLANDDIQNLTQFLFTFGKLMQKNPVDFHFLSGSQVTEAYIRSHNIILYGTENQNPWVKFAFDYLPFRLIQNKARILTTASTELEIGGNHSTGFLELIKSPWTADKALLVLSGSDAMGLKKALNAVINNESRSKMEGNIALINEDASIESISSKDTRYISYKNQMLVQMTNWGKNLWFEIKYRPQILIYLLVFIVPIYMYIRRRRKKKGA